MSTVETTERKPQRKREPQPVTVLDVPNAQLKMATVEAVCGVSSPTIYRWVRAGSFPAPVKHSTRCTRWRADDVRAWLAARPAQNP